MLVSKEFITQSEISIAFNTIGDDSIKQYWLDRLVCGILGSHNWPEELSRLVLFEEYCAFCAEQGLPPKKEKDFLFLLHSQIMQATGSNVDHWDSEKKTVVIPSLKSSRKVFLASNPTMVSVITRSRYEEPQQVIQQKRKEKKKQKSESNNTWFGFSGLLIAVGITMLLIQLFTYVQAGSWLSFSVYSMFEVFGGNGVLAWLSSPDSMVALKTITSSLLKFSEVGVLLLLFGFLIKANRD